MNNTISDKERLLSRLNTAKVLIKANEPYYESYLVDIFDDNYYGETSLVFGKHKTTVESIWTDSDEHINIHVDDRYFEGDLLFKSLSKTNQLKIIEMLKKHYQ